MSYSGWESKTSMMSTEGQLNAYLYKTSQCFHFCDILLCSLLHLLHQRIDNRAVLGVTKLQEHSANMCCAGVGITQAELKLKTSQCIHHVAPCYSERLRIMHHHI